MSNTSRATLSTLTTAWEASHITPLAFSITILVLIGVGTIIIISWKSNTDLVISSQSWCVTLSQEGWTFTVNNSLVIQTYTSLLVGDGIDGHLGIFRTSLDTLSVEDEPIGGTSTSWSEETESPSTGTSIFSNDGGIEWLIDHTSSIEIECLTDTFSIEWGKVGITDTLLILCGEGVRGTLLYTHIGE